MKWRTLSKDKAKELMEDYIPGNPPMQFDDDDCKMLRQELMDAWHEAEKKVAETGNQGKNWYPMDMEFGLGVYRVFSGERFHMTPRLAADTGIWRYIAVKIIPDLVTTRWPEEKSWNDRIFSKPRRIYPKFLWWYIYLCWQGNEKDTRMVIEGNSEDTILQMVDRAGANGYRPELYRAIIKRLFFFSTITPDTMELFRRVMKLNTARLVTTEPELTEGGIPQYVEELFSYINETKTS